MDDAALVRGFERVENLRRDAEGLVQGIAPCTIRSASVSPSTSSITSEIAPSDFSRP
jgi:hypothetical protein